MTGKTTKQGHKTPQFPLTLQASRAEVLMTCLVKTAR